MHGMLELGCGVVTEYIPRYPWEEKKGGDLGIVLGV